MTCAMTRRTLGVKSHLSAKDVKWHSARSAAGLTSPVIGIFAPVVPVIPFCTFYTALIQVMW